MSLNENYLPILKAINTNNSSEKQISKALKLSSKKIRYYLKKLEEQKFITADPRHPTFDRDESDWEEYYNCKLTPKGEVALEDPDDLIPDQLSEIVNTNGGNYNKLSVNFGVGINKGAVNTNNLAGIINEAPSENDTETIAEIKELLQQLEQSHPTTTTAEQMLVAAEAIKIVESNPDFKQRAINALTGGSLAALKKVCDNPVGACVVGAIEGWKK